MQVKKYFRGNKVSEGLEVTKEGLENIVKRCPYVSISEADKSFIIDFDDIETVGVIMGDIDNVLVDIAGEGIEPANETVANPDCWFVNKEFISKNYKELNTPETRFAFGEAIELLKLGYKVAREGWNGKGMWLIYVPASTVVVRENTPYGNAGLAGKELTIDGHIDMFTAKGTMQPGWLASQADIQAEDWVVVLKD